MNTKLVLTVLFSLLVAQLAWGQIPQTMSHQGVLTDADGNAVNDNRTLTFRFYEQAEGGEPLWEETQEVQVVNGLFNVIPGSGTLFNLPFDQPGYRHCERGQHRRNGPVHRQSARGVRAHQEAHAAEIANDLSFNQGEKIRRS